MSVYERAMGLGDWEISLAPDTPREIRDMVIPFTSHIVIMPTRVRAEDMSSALLPEAKFHGVVVRPGPRRTIGGHGLAFWLGNGDRYYTSAGSPNDLPRMAIVNGGVGTTLTTQAGWVTNGTGLTLGTVTDPSSGLRLIAETVQWISHRELLDSICDYWDVEWKLSTTGVLDIGDTATLWPTVRAAVTPNAAGRNIGLAGFESLTDVQDDFWGYASRLYVRSRGGIGEAGGVSPYRGFAGMQLFVSAVVDGQSVPSFDHQFAATRMMAIIPTGRADSVTITTDQYDVTGTIEVGGRIYAYDPETTLTNISTTPVYWQGDVILPTELRVMSVRWPVEDGMGVLLRYYTDSGGSVWNENWLDLTDYVEWEPAGTEIEIGTNVRPEQFLP